VPQGPGLGYGGPYGDAIRLGLRGGYQPLALIGQRGPLEGFHNPFEIS
jgi:hypothetical protein